MFTALLATSAHLGSHAQPVAEPLAVPAHNSPTLRTPPPMPPDSWRVERPDGRADLWPAGVMLYELLVGRSPFAASTSVMVMHNALHVDPTPVSSLLPEVPPAVVL